MSYESIRISAEDMGGYIFRELDPLSRNDEGLTVRQLADRVGRRLARDVTVGQVWNGISYLRQGNSPVHMISEQRAHHSIHRITKNPKDVTAYARKRAADWGTDLVRIAAQLSAVKDMLPAAQEMYDQLVEAIRQAHTIMPKERKASYSQQVKAMLDLDVELSRTS